LFVFGAVDGEVPVCCRSWWNIAQLLSPTAGFAPKTSKPPSKNENSKIATRNKSKTLHFFTNLSNATKTQRSLKKGSQYSKLI
jgi:hypothetical protein